MAPIENGTQVMPDWELEELSVRVARRVEDKLLAKFGRWVVLLLIAISGLIVSGLIGFFDLKGDVRTNQTMNQVQNENIRSNQESANNVRNAFEYKLDRLSGQVTELTVLIRSQNAERDRRDRASNK